MENLTFVTRDINGSILEIYNSKDFKSLLDSGNSIFLCSYFTECKTINLSKFKNEYWVESSNSSLMILKKYPTKKIFDLLYNTDIDTIEIN